MRGDNQVTLLQIDYGSDDVGNQTENIVSSLTVFCDEESVKRSEFYAASVHDLKPEIVLVVRRYEYSNEPQVEYRGVRYRVLRTFARAFEDLELVCSRVVADGV